MKASTADRLVVIFSAALLLLWTGCLLELWSRSFAPDGQSWLLSLIAAGLALAVAARLPGWIARAAMFVRRGGVLQEITSRRPSRGVAEVKAMGRTMGLACILAAGCFIAAQVLILQTGWIVDRLGAVLMVGQAEWALLELGLKFVGMLPPMFGLSLVFLSGGILRNFGGQDRYGRVVQEWTAAAAVAAAALAGVYLLGADLIGIGVVCGVLLIGLGLAMWLRKELSVAPVADVPYGQPTAGVRMVVFFTPAVLVAAAFLQFRLLADLLGLCEGGLLLVLAVVLGGLAYLLLGRRGRGKPAGPAQAIGISITLAMTLLAQVVFMLLAVQHPFHAITCWILIALAEIPVLAMTSILLTRQRKVFAGQGGRARDYLSRTAAGAAVGVLVAMVGFWTSVGLFVLLGLWVIVLVGATVRGIRRARRSSDVLRWTVLCPTLMLSALIIVESMRRSSQSENRTWSAGVWLTMVRNTDEDPAGRDGFLPHRRPWRSPEVTHTIFNLQAARQGQWWLVYADRKDLPQENPLVTVPAVSMVDASAWTSPSLPHSPESGRRSLWGRLRRRSGTFAGVFYSPMRLTHPQAWRVWDAKTLHGVRRSAGTNGVLLVRAQATRGELGRLLAVSKTFLRQTQTGRDAGWAVVSFNDRGDVDLLLAGPARLVEKPRTPPNSFVVPVQQLWSDWSQVRVYRAGEPPGMLGRFNPTPEQLVRQLRR
ncbi:MAG: hypothetical protein ACLFVU_02410 [Phycisphaerae bacterium]